MKEEITIDPRTWKDRTLDEVRVSGVNMEKTSLKDMIKYGVIFDDDIYSIRDIFNWGIDCQGITLKQLIHLGFHMIHVDLGDMVNEGIIMDESLTEDEKESLRQISVDPISDRT